MKRLAELVHPELLDAEEHDGGGPVRDAPGAHRPARHLAARPRIAAPGEEPERPLHHGMGEVHEEGVAAGQEHAQAPDPLDERLRAEGEARHRPLGAAGGGAAHRFVDDVAPAREIGAEHPMEAGLLGGPELRPAGAGGHCGLQRLAERAVVEIDLPGEGVEQCRLARLLLDRGARRRIDLEDGASPGCIDPAIDIGRDRARVLASDQAAVHGTVEDLVDGTEVFPDLVRLADHMAEKAQVRIGIADEVVHRHVAGLAVAVEPAVALLKARRVPGAVIVQQVAGGSVQVETLGRGVRGDEHAHRRGRVVERRLDVLAARLVHALGASGSEQSEHPVGGVALPQAPGEVVEGGLVLREDDQALVVAELAARAEQALHERDEGVETGVGSGRRQRASDP